MGAMPKTAWRFLWGRMERLIQFMWVCLVG